MLPIQCKMARTAIGLGVRELAEAAKVSPDTIARFERGAPLRERTVEAIARALESAGVEFIAENGGGPGVRLRKAGARTDLSPIGEKSKPASEPARPLRKPAAILRAGSATTTSLAKAKTAIDEVPADATALHKDKATRKSKPTAREK